MSMSNFKVNIVSICLSVLQKVVAQNSQSKAGIMSSSDFFGPALPPDFNVQSTSTSANAGDKTKKRGRLHRNMSDSSSSCADHSTSQSDSSSEDENVDAKISQPESFSTVGKVMGPALPPGFLSSDHSTGEFIGPVIPVSALGTVKSGDAEDDMFIVGPLPESDGVEKSYSTLDQLEARAKRMKDKLLGTVTKRDLSFVHYATFIFVYFQTLS